MPAPGGAHVSSPAGPTGYADDEFTDLELTELDGVFHEPAPEIEPVSAIDPAPVPVPIAADADLAQAQAIAARLREHAVDLDALADTDLVEHLGFYQRTHTELQRALDDLEQS